MGGVVDRPRAPFHGCQSIKNVVVWCQKISHVLGVGVLVSRVVEEDFSFPLKGLPLCAGGASFTSPPYRITPKTIYDLHDPTAVSLCSQRVMIKISGT